MAVVDFIIKIDNKYKVKEVNCTGEYEEDFRKKIYNYLIEKDIHNILGLNGEIKEGIIEICNKFFKYQWIDESDEAKLFLSNEGVLTKFYEQSINQVSEGIQIFDRNGFFMYGNPASEALEDYKNEDFKGKHLLDLYDLKEEYSTILTVLRTKKPVLNRCDRFKTRKGKSLTTINFGYPIKINGTTYGAVVFESDISLLKNIKNRTLNLEAYVESQHSVNKDVVYSFDDIIHTSESMKKNIHFSKKISLSDSSVLIVGDTGTGKELFAQSIHAFSPRRHKPFIDVNCSAVPNNLFESMFFGTEKGAFTGSMKKEGFFEMANGGTLFLDEINSISTEMQAKLLRVLQEKRFRRIGGSEYIECDVRIIATSNEDTFKLMEEGRIRKDFYYRIATIKIDIKPLRERKEDIPILTKYFLNQLCTQYNRQNLTISKEVLNIFVNYNWPGNVRELRHVIEYILNRAPQGTEKVKFEYLPDYLKSSKSTSHKIIRNSNSATFLLKKSKTFKQMMDEFEKKIIIQTLTLNNGNITKSAEKLGMSRQSLQYRIKKLNISVQKAK